MYSILLHLVNEIRKHTFDYLLLLTSGAAFLLFISILRGEPNLQFIVIVAFVAFYVIWGVYHHAVNQDIRLKIVVEYILIGFTILYILKTILIP